jgi:Phage major capsid protein E
MSDLFSTDTLQAIVADLRVPKSGLLDTFFPNVTQDDTEEIHFDVDNNPRRIAPFVSPLVAGKVVKSRGYATTTFKPAYVKDKRVFTPNRAFKRVMGEKIGGSYSPEQRVQLLLAQDLEDQMDMVTRRMEWMAAQALYSGSVVVASDDYSAVTVNFGRDASLSITKTAGNLWGDAGIKPLDDLQDWSDTINAKSGGIGQKVVMTIDVWKKFRADADVKSRLDRWRGNSTMQADAHLGEGLVFQGMVDQFAIHTYSGRFVDPVSNVETTILPVGTVLMGDDAIEGARCFGAIQDVGVLKAMPYYTKSWDEQDPSVRYLMMQSSPLMVPYRPNASLRAKVL